MAGKLFACLDSAPSPRANEGEYTHLLSLHFLDANPTRDCGDVCVALQRVGNNITVNGEERQRVALDTL